MSLPRASILEIFLVMVRTLALQPLSSFPGYTAQICGCGSREPTATGNRRTNWNHGTGLVDDGASQSLHHSLAVRPCHTVADIQYLTAVTKEDIQAHFSKDGTGNITEVKLMNGFGFIEYDDPLDARDMVPGKLRLLWSIPMNVANSLSSHA